jgi:predicted DNA-binding antitoxin AbrB/MazE fold protein
MLHDIEAIYDHGVFRPIGPVAVPEGTRVSLRIEEEGSACATSNGTTNYRAWLDSISGQWQGDFVRGDEGRIERIGKRREGYRPTLFRE